MSNAFLVEFYLHRLFLQLQIWSISFQSEIASFWTETSIKGTASQDWSCLALLRQGGVFERNQIFDISHIWRNTFLVSSVNSRPTGDYLIWRAYNPAWWRIVFLMQGLFVFKVIGINHAKNFRDKKAIRPQNAYFSTIICNLLYQCNYKSSN